MTTMIYEPKGRAREYSPLALNVYSQGCEHGCSYCYCRGIGPWSATPTPRNLDRLYKEAVNADKQILLCFISDPYGPCERKYRNTRRAIEILKAASCSVAVLTKGGSRCLDDLDLFIHWPDGRVKVGATLTFCSPDKSRKYEPLAALPQDRMDALKTLHESNVKTWVSIEPVIDPEESLDAIRRTLDYVDGYKVGRLNHYRTDTDWNSFGCRAVAMIREAGKMLYVKDDLRSQMRSFAFRASECEPETMFLPKRGKEKELF